LRLSLNATNRWRFAGAGFPASTGCNEGGESFKE
jgi:hypothetical protein